MELKQLQSFCAVVEYRSFTKAAEKLYISQPTISTHIRQLEEELQTLLLIRTTKRAFLCVVRAARSNTGNMRTVALAVGHVVVSVGVVVSKRDLRVDVLAGNGG